MAGEKVSFWKYIKKIAHSDEDAGKATKAHLGDENKFYYNKELKRWVVRGEEHLQTASTALPPPPKTASPSHSNAIAGSGGSNEAERVVERARGFAGGRRRNAASLYTPTPGLSIKESSQSSPGEADKFDVNFRAPGPARPPTMYSSLQAVAPPAYPSFTEHSKANTSGLTQPSVLLSEETTASHEVFANSAKGVEVETSELQAERQQNLEVCGEIGQPVNRFEDDKVKAFHNQADGEPLGRPAFNCQQQSRGSEPVYAVNDSWIESSFGIAVGRGDVVPSGFASENARNYTKQKPEDFHQPQGLDKLKVEGSLVEDTVSEVSNLNIREVIRLDGIPLKENTQAFSSVCESANKERVKEESIGKLCSVDPKVLASSLPQSADISDLEIIVSNITKEAERVSVFFSANRKANENKQMSEKLLICLEALDLTFSGLAQLKTKKEGVFSRVFSQIKELALLTINDVIERRVSLRASGGVLRMLNQKVEDFNKTLQSIGEALILHNQSAYNLSKVKALSKGLDSRLEEGLQLSEELLVERSMRSSQLSALRKEFSLREETLQKKLLEALNKLKISNESTQCLKAALNDSFAIVQKSQLELTSSYQLTEDARKHSVEMQSRLDDCIKQILFAKSTAFKLAHDTLKFLRSFQRSNDGVFIDKSFKERAELHQKILIKVLVAQEDVAVEANLGQISGLVRELFGYVIDTCNNRETYRLSQETAHTREISDLKYRLEELQGSFNSLYASSVEQAKQLAASETELYTLNEAYLLFKQRNESLAEELKEKNADFSLLDEKVNSLSKELQQEEERFHSELDGFKRNIDMLKAENLCFQEIIEQKTIEYDDLSKDRRNSVEECGNLRKELKKLAESKENLRTETEETLMKKHAENAETLRKLLLINEECSKLRNENEEVRKMYENAQETVKSEKLRFSSSSQRALEFLAQIEELKASEELLKSSVEELKRIVQDQREELEENRAKELRLSEDNKEKLSSMNEELAALKLQERTLIQRNNLLIEDFELSRCREKEAITSKEEMKQEAIALQNQHNELVFKLELLNEESAQKASIISRLEGEKTEDERKKKNLEEELRKLQQTAANIEQKLIELQHQKEELQQIRTHNEEEIENMRLSLQAKDEKMSSLVSELERKLKSLDEQNFTLNDSNAKLKAEITMVNAAKAEIHQKFLTIHKTYSANLEEAQKLQASVISLEEEVGSLKKLISMDNLKKSYEDLSRQNEVYKMRNMSMISLVDYQAKKLQILEVELKKNPEGRNLLQQLESTVSLPNSPLAAQD